MQKVEDLERLRAIQNMAAPTNITELQAFSYGRVWTKT